MRMRRLKHQISWAVLSIILITVFMNCGPSFQAGSAGSTTSSSATAGGSSNTAVANQAKAVLQNRCASCHTSSGGGALSNITDLNHLVTNRWIIPGDPNNSPILRRTADGSMPPGQPLSNSEQTSLYNYVVSLGTSAGGGAGGIGAPGGPVAGGTPTPTPTPVIGGGGGAVIAPTFTNVYNSILQPRCLGCHGSAGGYSYANFNATRQSVNVNNPAASRLYASVANNSMPRGSGPLTAAEKKLILDWITAGALNN